jgi:UDP-glucose 4-epimerase
MSAEWSGRRVLVTGGAGFIGSNLVDHLLAQGADVVVFDDLRTGHERFVASEAKLFRGDISELHTLCDATAGCDLVMHLAANADVRGGPDAPRRDLEANLLGTWNVLEAMRRTGVRDMIFTSTSAVYGEPSQFPTTEECPFPIQTSLYGASKLGAEGFVSAYAHAFGMRTAIVRLVSIVGERYSHGHVFDFAKSLLANPESISVLGDGQQRKAYLYVGDCVRAFRLIAERLDLAAPTAVYNIGGTEPIRVVDSLDAICDEMGVTPERTFTGSPRGWIGDSPLVNLAAQRLGALGWEAEIDAFKGIRRTVRWLIDNQWIMQERA